MRTKVEFWLKANNLEERQVFGLELSNRASDRHCVILPSTYEDHASNPYKVTEFDERGAFGDTRCKSLVDCLNEALVMGYKKINRGIVDILSEKPSFLRGVEVQKIRDELNGGIINWDEFTEKLKGIDAKYIMCAD